MFRRIAASLLVLAALVPVSAPGQGEKWGKLIRDKKIAAE